MYKTLSNYVVFMRMPSARARVKAQTATCDVDMAATSASRLQKIYERDGRNTSSNDPKMMEARVFIGNLPLESVTRQIIEEMYKEFGKILGISLHKSYGFVQFDNAENANAAVQATHGKTIEGKRIGELK